MTEMLRGKTPTEAGAALAAFGKLVTTHSGTTDREGLGDLLLFGRLREFPTRVKCVTLAGRAAQSALAAQ